MTASARGPRLGQHPTRGSLAAIAVAWAVVGLALVVWLAKTPNGGLRTQLIDIHFWALEAQFLLFLLATGIAIPTLFKALRLERVHVLWAVGIAATAILVTITIAPRTNRIYYDEQIYQQVGRNLSDLHQAQMCNDGNVEYGRLLCFRGEYNKQPYGYPYLLSVAYRILGARSWVATALNNLVPGLLVLVVFLTASLLLVSRGAAVLSGAVVACLPQLHLWSNTAAAEPTAALFSAIAFLSAVWAARERTTSALAWMFAATVFAMQLRPESVLVAPIVVVVLAVGAPSIFLDRRLWLIGLFALVLTLPLLAHLWAVRGEGWGASGDKFSLAFAGANLRMNGLFYLDNTRFPVLVTLLALLGLSQPRRFCAAVPTLVYFLSFFSIYLLFYAGSYNFGADVRYSLLTYPPLAILAAFGCERIQELAARRFGARIDTNRWIAATLLVSLLWFLPLIRAVGEEAWGSREDVAFAEQFAQKLPTNSYVFTHNPNMFHLWGVNAGQASLATTDPGGLDSTLVSRYAGGVFFYWNYWCNVADPVQLAFCENILKRYPHELLEEKRVRTYRYAFYRLLLEDQTAARHP